MSRSRKIQRNGLSKTSGKGFPQRSWDRHRLIEFFWERLVQNGYCRWCFNLFLLIGGALFLGQVLVLENC